MKKINDSKFKKSQLENSQLAITKGGAGPTTYEIQTWCEGGKGHWHTDHSHDVTEDR